MRIITLEEFLNTPKGTVYSSSDRSGLFIKRSEKEEFDFKGCCSTDLTEELSNTQEYDLNTIDCFEGHETFVIYEKEEIQGFINYLQNHIDENI